jgi:hypothetical protein
MERSRKQKMKNIVLSIVVISALVAAGIGGTLADFSDMERSDGNRFSVGSLDLEVSTDNVNWYDGEIITALIIGDLASPCCSKDSTFYLHNKGEGQGTGYAYLHIKDLVCSELPGKYPDGRTETENVAENGGWIGNVEVPGIGPLGADCTLGDYVEVVIEYDIDGDGVLDLIAGNPVWGGANTVYLSDVACTWYALGELPKCNTRVGNISMHISDIPEGDFLWDDDDNPATDNVPMDFFPDTSPLNDWPTNALQLDKVTFIVEFGLFQRSMPAGTPVYYPAP